MGGVNHPGTKKNTINVADQNINPATEDTLNDFFSQYVSSADPKKILIDTVGSVMYIGTAAPGTLTSADSWSIIKFDESVNPSSITNGVGMFTYTDCVWDDRATLTYQ